MAEIGADPEDLRALASEFRAGERQLERTSRTVARLVRGADWHGRDADRFRQRWGDRRASLRSAGIGLRDAATELDRHITEQHRASDASPTGDGPASDSGPGPVPPLTRIAPEVAAGPPPHWEPLPLEVRSWELGGGAAVVLGGTGAMRWTEESLPGGRTMLWIEDTAGAYITGGVGFGAGVEEGPGLEVSAGASAGADTTTRRGWEVADGDLDDLRRRLGLAEFLDRNPAFGGSLLPAAPGIPFGSGPVLDWLADRATEFVGLDAPDPTVTERLLSVGGEAGAGASLGLPLAGAGGLVAAEAGLRTRGDDRSVLLRTTGAFAGEAVWAGPSGSARTTVELPVVEGDTQPLVITQERTDDERVTVHRRMLEVDRPEAVASVEDMAGSLSRGDAGDAVESIRDLLDGFENPPVWQDSSAGVLDDDVYGVGGSVSAGARVDIGVAGGRTVIDFRPGDRR